MKKTCSKCGHLFEYIDLRNPRPKATVEEMNRLKCVYCERNVAKYVIDEENEIEVEEEIPFKRSTE